MARRDRRPLHSDKPRLKKPDFVRGKAPGEPDTKIERVRAAVAAEDWREALRLVMKLPSLGLDEEVVSRAWEAMVRPEFLRQVKRDPEAAIEEGKAALRRRFEK